MEDELERPPNDTGETVEARGVLFTQLPGLLILEAVIHMPLHVVAVP